jgi:hypothetical protein
MSNQDNISSKMSTKIQAKLLINFDKFPTANFQNLYKYGNPAYYFVNDINTYIIHFRQNMGPILCGKLVNFISSNQNHIRIKYQPQFILSRLIPCDHTDNLFLRKTHIAYSEPEYFTFYKVLQNVVDGLAK